MTTPSSLLDEQERLQALHELHVLDTPREERFDRVTRLCQRLFGVPMAFVNMIDRDRQWTKSAQGLDDISNTPRQESICTATIQHEQGLIVVDTAADARFSQLPMVAGDPFIRFYAGVPIAARGGARVGTLCIADTTPRQFSEPDRILLRDLGLWVEKELNIDEELDRAAEVQSALLPSAPPSDPRWDVAAVCRPAREIGGDFYDWYSTELGTVVTLGDVMGKGMPAAIVMATIRAAIRSSARVPDLGSSLAAAGAAVFDDLMSTGTFATVLQARLGDQTVEWVDAGHGYGVLVRADGSVEALEERGLPLGIDRGEHYRTVHAELGEGDLLLAHSDGLIETPGGPMTSAEAARIILGAGTAREAVQRLVATIGAASPPDDVTVLVARVRI